MISKKGDDDMANEQCPECGRDGYHSPSITVDAVAIRDGEYGLEILMIKRGPKPSEWAGMWAFPGGFVDYGEDPEDAVLRELEEETGVVGRNPVALTILGAPGRDPRKHCVGIFYLVEVNPTAAPIGADDAVDAAWLPIGNLGVENVACDHASVVDLLRE
jgi:8-oxo-dGTP diphosphatase